MTEQIDILDRLSAPFPPELVSWRVGSTNRKNWSEGKPKRGKPLCYIDARDVMERLTEVMGVHWQTDSIPMHNSTVCCRIGLLIEGDWIWRCDGAGATDVEGAKGAYSDAFKRAAVQWGVGRYLYGIDAPWIGLDDYWGISKDELPALHALLRGEKPQSARAARKNGDFERIVNEMREAEDERELAGIWTHEQAKIAAMPAGWRKEITTEKDRLKKEMQEARAAA